jgi:hypothetical protein
MSSEILKERNYLLKCEGIVCDGPHCQVFGRVLVDDLLFDQKAEESPNCCYVAFDGGEPQALLSKVPEVGFDILRLDPLKCGDIQRLRTQTEVIKKTSEISAVASQRTSGNLLSLERLKERGNVDGL